MKYESLAAICADLDADALLLTDPSDVRWACGFTGSSGWLLAGRQGMDFITDGRYALQAVREVQGARVHVPGYDLASFVCGPELAGGLDRVLFRSDVLSVSDLKRLKMLAPAVYWHGVERILARNRAAKNDQDVAAIVRAQRITEAAFDQIIALIRPGLTEKEIAAEIVFRQLSLGADRMSFDPIVASGPNSALPHARPGDRVLQAGDPVLLDFGCMLDGFASDMTRMVSLGRPTDDFLRVESVVREALDAASEAAHSGMTPRDLDQVARGRIVEAGHGESFPHSLGHGVGLDVHEWPTVSWRSEDPLPEACVVTLEPGIYLDGRFGVRIEDMVRLRPDGCDVLTRASRDLVIV